MVARVQTAAKADLGSDKLGLKALASCTKSHLLSNNALPGVVHLCEHLVPPVLPLLHPVLPHLGQPLPRVYALQVTCGVCLCERTSRHEDFVRV